MVEIAPIAPEHIESFHRLFDSIARERRYLAALEAPPLESFRSFVLDTISQGHARFAALAGDEVVGWCDVLSKQLPIHRHVGVLGMGLLPAYRGQGVGRRLLQRTLEAARAGGLSRVELTVREDNPGAIAAGLSSRTVNSTRDKPLVRAASSVRCSSRHPMPCPR